MKASKRAFGGKSMSLSKVVAVFVAASSIATFAGCGSDAEPSVSNMGQELASGASAFALDGFGGAPASGGFASLGGAPACTSGPNRLCAGAQLTANQSKHSNNGKYDLVYQSDGALVLHRTADAKALWSSGTSGTTPNAAQMGQDARLRVLDASGAVAYVTPNASVTTNPPAHLLVSNTGIAFISNNGDLTAPGLWRSGDPECTTGVARDNACCAKSCGVCGGNGCSGRPGGGSGCCMGNILSVGRSCGDHQPPCVIP